MLAAPPSKIDPEADAPDGGSVPLADSDHLLEAIRQRLGVAAVTLYLTRSNATRIARRAGSRANALKGRTSFADHIPASGVLVVPDTETDPQFWLDPLVTGQPAIRFYAGIALYGEADQPIGVLSLFDTDPRTPARGHELAAVLRDVAARGAQQRTQARIAALRAELAAKSERVQALTAQLHHAQNLFERASATAKIGVWACNLDGEELTWTDAVHDMFELPRGETPDRQVTLKCYTPESRQALERLRSEAIRDCTGFRLDAEITTMKGNRRWIRLTATVDATNGVATRIFGMKQDITEEKILADRTRYLAEYDVMTGLANRSQFQARLLEFEQAPVNARHPIGALVLVDLDGFKQINDTFGHRMGDECLKEAAARLSAVCAGADLVTRIGGDEFAVLLGPDTPAAALAAYARTIVAALNQPVVHNGTSTHLSASIGVAHIADCPAIDLFKHADAALYAAKAAGRNTFRVHAQPAA